MEKYFVYILTNKYHNVFYIGFTDDLERRVYEHRNKIYKGFTAKYNVDKLVYFESFLDKESALAREKQMKKYKKEWKQNLIEDLNPNWNDLYEDFLK